VTDVDVEDNEVVAEAEVEEENIPIENRDGRDREYSRLISLNFVRALPPLALLMDRAVSFLPVMLEDKISLRRCLVAVCTFTLQLDNKPGIAVTIFPIESSENSRGFREPPILTRSVCICICVCACVCVCVRVCSTI
jgi:hypothetical protein